MAGRPDMDKDRQLDAPSFTAASSISRGMDFESVAHDVDRTEIWMAV